MAAGTVVIDADGTVSTSTGAAGRRYAILAARFALRIPGGIPAGPAGAGIKQALAETAIDDATWLSAEIGSHANGTVGTGLSGLQRMPAVTTEDTDTKAPGTAKTIPLVLNL